MWSVIGRAHDESGYRIGASSLTSIKTWRSLAGPPRPVGASASSPGSAVPIRIPWWWRDKIGLLPERDPRGEIGKPAADRNRGRYASCHELKA